MIKILHPKFIEYGGAERKILLLSQYIINNNIKLTIYTNKINFNASFPEINENLKENIQIIKFPRLLWIIYLNIILIKSIFDKTKLIVLSNHPSQLAAILATMFGLGNRIIWICNEVQESLREKICIHNIIILLINRFLCRHFKRIIANSSNTSLKILNIYKCNSDIVYPGLDINYIRNLINSKPDELCFSNYFLFIGRIEEEKNIDLLIKIIKCYPEYNFVVIGSGSSLSYYKNKTNNLSNVIWLGSVSEKNKFNYLEFADGLIFTSKDEPFGVVIIEALSLGCPVLAFNNGGPKEIIIDNEMGILVNTDCEFIKSVSKLKRNDMSRSRLLNYIENSYSTEIMLRKILS